MRWLSLAATVAAAAALAAPAASDAYVGCSTAGNALTITMTERGDAARIVRNGQNIDVVVSIDPFDFGDGPSVAVGCSGPAPTVTSTDTVAISATTAVVRGHAEIDLGGGAFAPGATPEADGTSEIEFQADMPGELSVLEVTGTAGNDAIEFGQRPDGGFGANLNGAYEAASPDVDVELNDVEIPGASGGPGPDTITALGGGAFAGPLRTRGFAASGGTGRDRLIGGPAINVLFGGSGDDKIFGSTRSDLLVGERGNDLMAGKSGVDLIDGKFLNGSGKDRDRARCGPGVDFAYLDKADARSGCEPVTRKRRLNGKFFKRIILVYEAASGIVDP